MTTGNIRKMSCRNTFAAVVLCAAALSAGAAHGDEKHPDLIGYRRCIPMEAFLRTDPGLRQIGLFRTRESSEIASSRWSVGCECLDREFADFKAYAKYLGKTGAKHARAS